MANTYQPYDLHQSLLMPPSLDDWLPEDHLARFVSDTIDATDLSPFRAYYEREERGFPPYHPAMMTKLLVYGPDQALALEDEALELNEQAENFAVKLGPEAASGEIKTARTDRKKFLARRNELRGVSSQAGSP